MDLHQMPQELMVEKALYGLHQAPRAWYETFSIYLLDNGFHRGQIDKTSFIKRLKGDILLVQVYVDDIIFGSTKKSLCDDFEQIMHSRFQMSSMGELTFFLGLQVKQKENGIFISQDKYVGEILKKYDLLSIRSASTLMETHKALTKDEGGEDVDVYLYRSMIGSLMYLTSSRPDIMFSVCACSRFQVQPKVSHLHAVKRIFRYLKGQPKLGLWYPKDSPLILEAFSYSDYACTSLDRKSTTGGCQFLGSRLISWQCKKQTVVANSTTKDEYIAASHCCGQATKISQSSGSTNLVADETVHKELGDRMERAATIASSFEVEQDSGNGPRCQDTILGVADAQTRFETVSIKSNDLPLSRVNTLGSGEDSLKLMELMAYCTKLSELGRNIAEIDQDENVTLIDETQGQLNDEEMFGINYLHGEQVTIEDTAAEVIVKDTAAPTIPVTTAEVVTTVSAPNTITSIEELTLAQSLIEIKAAKPKTIKAVTTDATLVTTAAVTRPKAKVIVFYEHEQTHKPTVSSTQPSIKDKGKGIKIEPERCLKRKDQIAADEELARQLDAEMQAEIEEEERIKRQKEEEANIALIELWENKQAMMEADRLLAERLQTREREELTIEEKSKLFLELMNKRRKHFAELRAQEKRNKPPTNAQKRTQMSTYLKHIGNFKHSQLKSKTYEEIERLFEIEMKRVNSFIPMNADDRTDKEQERSSKRVGDDLEYDVSKKQRVDEHAKTTAWNEFNSTMASAIILFLDKQVEGMSIHKETFVISSHTKKFFANMRRQSDGFSGSVTPLFDTMMVQASEEVGENLDHPTDSNQISIDTQPSTSKP
ncbi:putative ribonuclease H-like domain-containing protein [Tanacetum coccineum]|uniref:Ribonuclease H-like domain-containing protein n=1 Tax=Tanacetum coccineum TaxID=301880 RepID=A0ABQ5HPX4_9ASTR